MVDELLPHAQIFKNANTYDLIAQSDIVISPSSSVITEALILDKPVFLFKFLENDSGIPYEKYNAVVATEDENKIDDKIKKILFDKKIRDNLKIGRKNFLEHTLEYQGISSQKIIQLIKNMIKKD
jgi:CDP-glycerol glycerophosphotransferase (TagB/SpsB family)